MEETERPGRPSSVGAAGPAEPGEEVLAGCRRGDRAAFGELFARTRDYVYGVALYATGDPAAAADVTQEVYLRLLSRIRQFDGRASFRTWLFRVTLNAARDQGRRRRREALPHAAPEPEPALSPEEELLARERSARLARQLAELPSGLRLPLVLRFAAGLSYEEIGSVLSLPAGTVASRLSRALARLGRGSVTAEGGP